MADLESARKVRPGLAGLDAFFATRLLKPDYLSSADQPWLCALIAERERFVEQPSRAWRAHVAGTLSLRAPASKVRTALRVMDRVAPACVSRSPWPPARKLREVVFREAARDADRARVLAAAAEEFGLEADAVLCAMFADIPEERRLAPWPGEIDAQQLVLLCNEAVIGGLLHRAIRVRIRAHGQVRAVVRQAHLSGLLCVVREGSTERDAEFEVSGPFALFRHSRLYGRALTGLLPRLARCNAFRLEAECVIAGQR